MAPLSQWVNYHLEMNQTSHSLKFSCRASKGLTFFDMCLISREIWKKEDKKFGHYKSLNLNLFAK